jgi:hypothetical protein
MLINLTKDLLDSGHSRLLALGGGLLDQDKGLFSASNRRLRIISSVGVGSFDVGVGSISEFFEALLSYFGASFMCPARLDI